MPEETTTKVYCCDRGNNDALAFMAGANRNNNDPMAMAAMMNGGMNQWMNNPFAYMMMMGMMRMMYGDNWQGRPDAQAMYSSLQNQISDNQNANLVMDGIRGNTGATRELATNLNCDFNALQQSICAVQAAIQQVAGQTGFSAERVINAVNMGDCNVIQAIKDCCCTTQKSILEMGYQNQLQNCQQTNTIMNGINTVNTGLERGFSSVAYETQRQTCDIINAGNANTQRIIDTLNCHWNQDLQQRYNDARLELSQLRQNATIIAALKPATTTGTTA